MRESDITNKSRCPVRESRAQRPCSFTTMDTCIVPGRRAKTVRCHRNLTRPPSRQMPGQRLPFGVSHPVAKSPLLWTLITEENGRVYGPLLRIQYRQRTFTFSNANHYGNSHFVARCGANRTNAKSPTFSTATHRRKWPFLRPALWHPPLAPKHYCFGRQSP